MLELYEPGTGRAAALRTPVTATELGSPGETRLSDLLLVEPGAPYHRAAASRTGSWVRPRTRPGAPEVGEAGVVFEIYDLPRGPVQYFLRTVLEDLETGERKPVAFKPVGTLEFRRLWERHRKGQGPVSEYLTVDLDDVKPGTYLLRVEVNAPDLKVDLEAARALEVG